MAPDEVLKAVADALCLGPQAWSGLLPSRLVKWDEWVKADGPQEALLHS